MQWSLSLALLLAAAVNAFDVDLDLQQSFDGRHFTEAGRLQGSLIELGGGRGEALTLLRKELSNDERNQLKNLVQRDGLYQLQIASDPSRSSSPKLLTSIPAKCLLSSGLQDHFHIHATPSGHFIGFNYDYSKHPCKLDSDNIELIADADFQESSKIPVWLPAGVPTLTKSSPILSDGGKKAKAGARSAVKKEGESEVEEDTRPWIVKNWMIALPLAFVGINIIGGIMAPQEDAPAPAGGPRRR